MESLRRQNYNMPKIRNIKLKHTILVAFLLLSIFLSVKNIATSSDNIATEQPNNETSYIKTVTEKILGEVGYLCGFRGNIIDWICTSIYNHYTEHDLRKEGWYNGKFYIYGGRKFEITKNVYLDVYYSLLKLIPFFIFDVIICDHMYHHALVSLLTININIHIYKNFYLAIAPISWIGYKIIDYLVRESHPKRTDQEIEDGKRRINPLKRKLTININ